MRLPRKCSMKQRGEFARVRQSGQAKTGRAAGDDGMTAVEIELVHGVLAVGGKTGMDSCLRRNDEAGAGMTRGQ